MLIMKSRTYCRLEFWSNGRCGAMKCWIMSASAAVYDHDAAFSELGYINWRQTRNFAVGDVVYIYCTRPASKVKYKTIVDSISVDGVIEKYWIKKQNLPEKSKYMCLRLVSKSEDESLSLFELQKHGMQYPPQSPCLVKPELQQYLIECFGEDDYE